jgi:hypothetical protein
MKVGDILIPNDEFISHTGSSGSSGESGSSGTSGSSGENTKQFNI